MALSQKQTDALRALGRQSRTPVAIAATLDTSIAGAQRVLDALIRRNLVAITPMGRYAATERGRKKVAA